MTHVIAMFGFAAVVWNQTCKVSKVCLYTTWAYSYGTYIIYVYTHGTCIYGTYTIRTYIYGTYTYGPIYHMDLYHMEEPTPMHLQL